MDKTGILIVENKKEIREFICAFLKRRGFDVYCAENSKETFNMLKDKSTKINICLIDYILGEEDEARLTKKLKKKANVATPETSLPRDTDDATERIPNTIKESPRRNAITM